MMRFAALLLLLLLAAAVFWLYTPDKSREALEAKYLTPADYYLDAAGIRLRVRDTGAKDAPALILLHGFASSLETWEAWAERLSPHYRVIRFDLPGFGLTGPDPTGDYSDARGVAIIAALMDRLGLSRATIIGNSMGGKLAWTFAAAHPDRTTKLILVSPDGFASPGFEYGKKPEIPAIVGIFPYILPRPILMMNLAPAYADPKRLDEATITRYRDMLLGPGDRRATIARMRQAMLHDPEPVLRTIQAPTLILWGEKDALIPFSNAADYVRVVPRATLAALPGLGHVPFEEAPDVSLKPVLAFLAAPL